MTATTESFRSIGRCPSQEHRMTLRVLLVLILASSAYLSAAHLLPAHGAESHYRLTSSSDGIHQSPWQTSGMSSDGVPWSVHKSTLHGGRQEGVEIVTIENGRLRITVVPTRGMSIYEVTMGDIRLGWNSPVNEIVHPHYVNLQSRGGLGWLEGFNEWMVRCGLEFAGHPGTDTFVNNVGDEAKMDLTLHGKIGNIPASEVEIIVTDDTPPRIRLRGRVDERMFYGPQLELWTQISTEVGSDRFRIDDTVTNRAANEQEFEIIYHANHGAPLLEEGTRFVAAVRQIMPMNDHAAKSIDNYSVYAGPTPGFVEQVYCIDPYGDPQGMTEILLHNRNADKGLSMRYSLEQLPHLTLWKNTLTEENGYVTGLEPGTSFPFNRRVERQFGRVPKLAPHASRSFGIEFQLHASHDSVQRTTERIAAIQQGQPLHMDRSPPKIAD